MNPAPIGSQQAAEHGWRQRVASRLVVIVVIAVIVSILGVALPSAAMVPLPRQALTLVRIMAYDRNLRTRAGRSATIVVTYRAGDPNSESVMKDFVGALNQVAAVTTVQGLRIQALPSEYRSAASFEAQLKKTNASVAYVCPGLDDKIAEISEATRRESALSVSGTPGWVERGLGIGFLESKDKVTIVINRRQTILEGAVLSSDVLRIAKVIQ